VETLLGFRHKLQEGSRAGLRIFLQDGGGLWLLMYLALTVGVIVVLAVTLRRQLRTGSAPLLVAACLLTIAALMLFAIESVAFGAITSILYHQSRDVMMVGWLWWAIGAGVSSCAFIARSRSVTVGRARGAKIAAEASDAPGDRTTDPPPSR